jgi:hypothetical protein
VRWLPIVGLRLGRRLIGLRQWPVKWAVDRRIIGPERSIRHDAAIGERHETAGAVGDNRRSRATHEAEEQNTLKHAGRTHVAVDGSNSTTILGNELDAALGPFPTGSCSVPELRR